MQESVKQQVESGENDTKNPSLFIHPYYDSGGSQNLTKLLQYIKFKAQKASLNKIEKVRKVVFNPMDFYTVQEAFELLKLDNSLIPSNRTTEAFNATIKEMLDFERNGKYKTGYIYPAIFEDGKSIVIKPMIFTCPEEGTWMPTNLYRRMMVQYNIVPLKRYLSNVLGGEENNTYSNPESYLITKNGESTHFNPYALSVLENLKKKVKESFQPYETIPLDEFYKDIFEISNQDTGVVAINKDYYILNKEIHLNDEGNPIREPESYFHYSSIFYAIEKLITTEVLVLSEKYGLPITKIKINQYIKELPKTQERVPHHLQVRLLKLSEINEGLVISQRMSSADKDLFLSIGDGLKLLKDFEKEIKNTHIALKESGVKKLTQFLISKIEEHFINKKTLYIYDIENPFPKSNDAERNSIENQRYFKKFIMDSYYYYEAYTSDGKTYYYILDPRHCISVLLRLAEVSKTNLSYTNQYNICKLLREKMISDSSPKLDSAVVPNQKKKLEDEFAIIQEKEKKEAIKAERKKSYNIILAHFSGAIMLIVSFYSFLLFESKIALFFIPISILVAYKLGDIFRKKKKNLLEMHPDLDISSGQPVELDSGIYVSLIEKVLYSKNLTLEDRIMTPESIPGLFRPAIARMREEKPVIKDIAEEILLQNLMIILANYSMIVNVPNKFKTKKTPEKIYLAREHLKDSLIRTQMMQYCESKAKQLQKAAQHDEYGYFQYLANLLDNDFKSVLI